MERGADGRPGKGLDPDRQKAGVAEDALDPWLFWWPSVISSEKMTLIIMAAFRSTPARSIVPELLPVAVTQQRFIPGRLGWYSEGLRDRDREGPLFLGAGL